MKKIFPLKDPAKDDQRVVEAIKHDIRKYAKRERRKPLPAGFDLWELQCRVGPGAVLAEGRAFKEVAGAIDAVAAAGSAAVYVEIVAVAAKWPARLTPGDGTAPGAAGPLSVDS
ncbi:MAG: DUF6172 family protein [Lacunisphaera sp.]|nr:DUF6172 family protein [Lacunisphaera sp.]